ncbi:MAG TPA: hypothetical protein VNT25_03740 [Allosphingosinicella sp.]|nr:hypothetical protein [Allosphingosinicella sp.]
MKSLIIVAALMVSGAAVAQQTGHSGHGKQTATAKQAQAQTNRSTNRTTNRGTTQRRANANRATPATPATPGVSPATPAEPAGGVERDARGIPVVSAQAEAPSGANQPVSIPAGAQVVPSPNQRAVFATRQATEEFPPCTAERTDRCVQTYEGRGRGGAMRSRSRRR